MQNVVLGRKRGGPNSEPGDWGALTDLHLAIEVDRDSETVSIDLRVVRPLPYTPLLDLTILIRDLACIAQLPY